MDLSSMKDMVTELSRPVDRAQLDQEIEDFNLTYPVNVDDAVNMFSLPPVAGTGTAPTTTTAPPSPPLLKPDLSRPPEHAPSPPLPPADLDPLRPPEHVLSPPPHRAPSPLAAAPVQGQGPPLRR